MTSPESEEQSLAVAEPEDLVNAIPSDDQKEESQERADSLIKRMPAAKQAVADILDRCLRNNIDGHPMSYWTTFFRVDIPSNPRMSDLISGLARLTALTPFANEKASAAGMTKKLFDRQVTEESSSLFVSYKAASKGKAPSNETVEAMINDKLKDMLLQQAYADFVFEFWNNQKLSLINSRKILETILIGLTSEMKNKNNSIHNPEPSESDEWS